MRRLPLVLGAVVALLAVPAGAQYFGKNKIRYDTFQWKVYATPHFRISFYDRVEPSLPKLASFAESAYDELARKLNFQIPDPVPLIAYATHADFEQTNVIVDFIPEGVGAFAVPARNRMVLPVDLPDVELQHLIQHELTHIFQYEILFQGKLAKALAVRPPQWFMEGMASYFGDDEDARARAVMRDATMSDEVPSVGSDPQGYFAYRFGHMVFQYVEAEWGPDGLRDFIFEFRNTLGTQVNRAIKRAFDLDVDEFDSRFRAWLRHYYQDLTVDRGYPRDYGPPFRVRERVRSYETSPSASPSGDLIAAFTTYKDAVDVALLGVPDRTLFRNLTAGYTTRYEYLIAQLLTVGPDRGRDLAFAPDGNLVATFARNERGRVLVLLDAIKGGIARELPIPVDQAMEPAFAPDGNAIAFHAFENGRADIYVLDLASGQVRNLTDDAAYDSSPAFAPDGAHLVYSSQVADTTKLFEISLADPTQRTQLTFGGGDDEGASFARDGTQLYFSSDRDQGIFDLYALDLANHALTRLTRVIGAALNPVVVPTREGDRVVYQAYEKSRWRLYLTDPSQGKPAGEEKPAEEEQPRAAFVPAVTVTVDQDKVAPVKRYKLFPDNLRVLVGIDQNQTLVSQTYLSFTDNYGDRRLDLLLESVSSYSNFQAQYVNLSKRLQWGAAVLDDRTYFVLVNPGDYLVSDRVQIWRQTGGYVFASYPLSVYHRVEGTAGYLDRSSRFLTLHSDGRVGFDKISDQLAFAEVGVVGDTTFWRDYGPHAGRRWSLEANAAYAVSGSTGLVSKGGTLDARQYVPLSRRNELAIRLFGFYANGDRPNYTWFGGFDTLRGYDYNSFIGNNAFYTNIEWRFPLIDHLVFPWLYLSSIRGRFFLDVGGAWWDVPGFHQRFRFIQDGRLEDAVASYGFGLSLDLFGVPMHWDFAKRWDFKQTLSRNWQTSFWIGLRY
jgi:Tol biopolymer transport system component